MPELLTLSGGDEILLKIAKTLRFDASMTSSEAQTNLLNLGRTCRRLSNVVRDTLCEAPVIRIDDHTSGLQILQDRPDFYRHIRSLEILVSGTKINFNSGSGWSDSYLNVQYFSTQAWRELPDPVRFLPSVTYASMVQHLPCDTLESLIIDTSKTNILRLRGERNFGGGPSNPGMAVPRDPGHIESLLGFRNLKRVVVPLEALLTLSSRPYGPCKLPPSLEEIHIVDGSVGVVPWAKQLLSKIRRGQFPNLKCIGWWARDPIVKAELQSDNPVWKKLIDTGVRLTRGYYRDRAWSSL